MTSKPSAKSSGKKRRAPVPQPHGGYLIPGAGGGPQPGSGRPPDWLKRQADDLLADPASWGEVQKIMVNNTHPMFAVMWGKLADRAHGRPKESVELTGKDGAPLTVRYVREGSRRTAG